MIARLSLEVFYIITRKLVGAFYVDQKKKDLLPSTLPSEHEQWGNNIQITSGGYGAGFVYPIVFQTKVLAVIPFDVNGDWTDDAIPSVHAAWFPDKGSDNNDLRWARIGFSSKNTLWGAYRFIAIGK